MILPLVLLFWPFAAWKGLPALFLRAVPAFAAQLLFCRLFEQPAVRLLPALLTGGAGTWGVYLYFTSPHWANATLGGLFADYLSPFICCALALVFYLMQRKTHTE